jgi:hypothetical protein
MGAPVMVSTVIAGAELLALRGALAACRTRAIASSGHLSTVLRQFTVSRGPERPEARAGLISLPARQRRLTTLSEAFVSVDRKQPSRDMWISFALRELQKQFSHSPIPFLDCFSSHFSPSSAYA